MGYKTSSTNSPETKSSKSARLKTIVFFYYFDHDPIATLRLLGAAKLAGWEIIHGYDSKTGMANLDAIDKADLVIIQREFCQDYEIYTKVKSILKSQNKPLILDLDDNLFVLPIDHPGRLNGYYVNSLLPLLQAVMEADLITVSTKPLREYLLPFNPNIQIIPNYLDDSIWQLSSQVSETGSSGKVTIGYMGGDIHEPDLKMILPILLQIFNKYPDHVNFHFWGIDAPTELAPYSKVDWYPTRIKRYDEFASTFLTQHADILIAPLCDNLFNSCKSPIKFLEYSAFGAPRVYTRVTPYADIVENGKDGFIASTTDEWMDGLSRLIESPSLRQEVVQNAQQKISKHWLLSKNINKRKKIYEDTISNFHPRTDISSSFYRIEKSLSEQYYEERKRNQAEIANRIEYIDLLNSQLINRDVEIDELNQQIKSKELCIKDLENEVVSYATSMSW